MKHNHPRCSWPGCNQPARKEIGDLTNPAAAWPVCDPHAREAEHAEAPDVLPKGGKPKGDPLAGCGTDSGYQQHRRRRDTPCLECVAAHSVAELQRKRDRARVAAENEQRCRREIAQAFLRVADAATQAAAAYNTGDHQQRALDVYFGRLGGIDHALNVLNAHRTGAQKRKAA